MSATGRQFNFALNFGGAIRQDINTGAAPPVPFGLAPATEPSLAAFTLADAFEDGEPNLFAALRWDYGLCERLYGRDVEMEKILAWARAGQHAATARLGPARAAPARRGSRRRPRAD